MEMPDLFIYKPLESIHISFEALFKLLIVQIIILKTTAPYKNTNQQKTY